MYGGIECAASPSMIILPDSATHLSTRSPIVIGHLVATSMRLMILVSLLLHCEQEHCSRLFLWNVQWIPTLETPLDVVYAGLVSPSSRIRVIQMVQDHVEILSVCYGVCHNMLEMPDPSQ